MNEYDIQTLENPNKDKRYVCEHIFPELTALCPTTALPDFYTVKIVYEPKDKLIELKSLKYYYLKYRNVKIYHEELANTILDDIVSIIQPRWIVIKLVVNVRGGISTTIKRYWGLEECDSILEALTENNF